MIFIHVHVHFGLITCLRKVECLRTSILFETHGKEFYFIKIFQGIKIFQFDAFKFIWCHMETFTILIKQFFTLGPTVVASFAKFSNSQTPEKAEMVLVSIRLIFIFFQTKNVSVVYDVVRECWRISWRVCCWKDTYLQIHNPFKYPFGCGMLVSKMSREIFRGEKIEKIVEIVLVLNWFRFIQKFRVVRCVIKFVILSFSVLKDG